MMLDIVVLILAVGNAIERQVGNLGQRFLQLPVGGLGPILKLRHRDFQVRDLGHQRLRARLVPRLLGLADVPGGRVAPRLRLLEGMDRRAPRLVGRQQPVRQRP